MLALGLGSLLLCISEAPRWGWTSLTILGLLAGAVVLLVAWVLWELKNTHPLINLRTLREGDVVLANISAIGLGAALYIGMSVGSLVAQAPPETGYGLGLPVLWAGFVIFPLSVGSFVANRDVRRRRVSVPRLGRGTPRTLDCTAQARLTPPAFVVSR